MIQLRISEENWLAFQAVNRGNATEAQEQRTKRAAQGSRWGNSLAQAAQDAQKGQLGRRENYG